MDADDGRRRLRAELAAELGYYPASLDGDDIDRHRRLNAAAYRAPSLDRVGRKYAHIAEQKRQHGVEAAGRALVANLGESRPGSAE